MTHVKLGSLQDLRILLIVDQQRLSSIMINIQRFFKIYLLLIIWHKLLQFSGLLISHWENHMHVLYSWTIWLCTSTCIQSIVSLFLHLKLYLQSPLIFPELMPNIYKVN